MISKFGFRNFTSFREGMEISFVDGKADFDHQIGAVLGIKGANGSGKTNILKALTFLYCLCSNRLGKGPSGTDRDKSISLPVDNFFGNGEPSEFYIEFSYENSMYLYELDVTKTGIIREELKRKNKRWTTFLVRKNDKVTYCLKELKELKSLKLKLNQSIITVVDDFSFNEPMTDLQNCYAHFSKHISNVGQDGYRKDLMSFPGISKFYYSEPEALGFTKSIISSVDDGVSDIKIEESTDKATGEKTYYPIFFHKFQDKEYPIGLTDESMGTKILFLNLSVYWQVIQNGGLLVMDEFDTHLHANILPELIELFKSKAINTQGAQIIVTAHNTEIIDSLGRYGTILVNKEDNESYCYRLDEIPLLRNDRPISPVYKKGKVGGVPKRVAGLTANLIKKKESKRNG